MQKYACPLLTIETRGGGQNKYNKAPIFALIFKIIFGLKRCTAFPVYSYS